MRGPVRSLGGPVRYTAPWTVCSIYGGSYQSRRLQTAVWCGMWYVVVVGEVVGGVGWCDSDGMCCEEWDVLWGMGFVVRNRVCGGEWDVWWGMGCVVVTMNMRLR